MTNIEMLRARVYSVAGNLLIYHRHPQQLKHGTLYRLTFAIATLLTLNLDSRHTF